MAGAPAAAPTPTVLPAAQDLPTLDSDDEEPVTLPEAIAQANKIVAEMKRLWHTLDTGYQKSKMFRGEGPLKRVKKLAMVWNGGSVPGVFFIAEQTARKREDYDADFWVKLRAATNKFLLRRPVAFKLHGVLQEILGLTPTLVSKRTSCMLSEGGLLYELEALVTLAEKTCRAQLLQHGTNVLGPHALSEETMIEKLLESLSEAQNRPRLDVKADAAIDRNIEQMIEFVRGAAIILGMPATAHPVV